VGKKLLLERRQPLNILLLLAAAAGHLRVAAGLVVTEQVHHLRFRPELALP
jgi:hypothetical protein